MRTIPDAPLKRRFRREHTYIAIIGTDSSYELWSVHKEGCPPRTAPTRKGRWMPSRPWCGSFVTGDGNPTFTRHIIQCRDFEHVELQVATLAAIAGGCPKLATPLKRGRDGRYHCPLCNHRPFLYSGTFASHLNYHGNEPLAMMIAHSPPPPGWRRPTRRTVKAV